MSLYKQAGSQNWWFKFRINKRQIRESSGTPNEGLAEQVEAKRKRELWEEARLGVAVPRLWEEAVTQYLAAMTESENKENTKRSLTWLGKHLGGWHIANITKDKLRDVRTAKIAAINEKKAKAAARGSPSRWPEAQPSAVNRFMGVVTAVLNYAVEELEWVEHVAKLTSLGVPELEPVWADRTKALKLISLLPPHQIPMVIFALSVGWRRSNVTHLRKAQVSLDRRFAWVTPEAAKERKGIPTPLPDIAMEVLEAQFKAHPESDYVFLYRGKPVTQTSTRAFRLARDAAGLPPNFTWHSLRHTWASWMAQDGIPSNILKELGGWSSDKMPARYAHLGGEHLRPYVDGRVSLSGDAVRGALGIEKGIARKRKTGKTDVSS